MTIYQTRFKERAERLFTTYGWCDPFESFGVDITDPTMDETGRFEVDPSAYYGVTFWLAVLRTDYDA